MSESYLDGLLDELVRVEPRESWDDVLQRARRAQRRYVAVVVTLAVLVLAPATWAAYRAFEGTPAPPSIKQDFTLINGSLSQSQALAATNGVFGQIQQADISKAHGVLEVQTPYGPLDLWAAPEFGGQGQCWFTIWVRKTSNPHGSFEGSCSNPGVPAAPIDVSPGWDSYHPTVAVLDGSVTGPETTLEVKFTDGQATTLPVVEHLVLGVVPQHGPRSPGIAVLIGRDASGKVVACEGLFSSLQQKEKACS
jgi:hypothetical protein